MKKIACWCCSFLIFIGCSKDMEEVVPDRDRPAFFLQGNINGEEVRFDVTLQDDIVSTGGVYYNGQDATEYQMGFYRNQQNRGPWYANWKDNFESLVIYFPPQNRIGKNDGGYDYLRSPKSYDYRFPRPGSGIGYRAHLYYSGYGWYLVGSLQEMNMRWDFGEGWEPFFSWNSQTSTYTQPHLYTDYHDRDIRLETFDTDGKLLRYDQIQFDFADESKLYTISLRPQNDSLYARVSGTPPYTYQWDNGSTDLAIIPAGKGKQQYCVTVTDGLGRENRACATYFFNEDGSELEKIYSGQGIYGVNKEIVIEAFDPQGISITYTSPQGKIYYSQLRSQPNTSSFAIKKAGYYERRSPCIDFPCPESYLTSYALSIRFNCTLYNPDGSSIELKDVEALMPFFPQAG
ncbi:MAG: hypothetical protein R2824_13390 [Saprospiraceae bacterium]|nr:hypothetical protein [Lewinella sp.]